MFWNGNVLKIHNGIIYMGLAYLYHKVAGLKAGCVELIENSKHWGCSAQLLQLMLQFWIRPTHQMLHCILLYRSWSDWLQFQFSFCAWIIVSNWIILSYHNLLNNIGGWTNTNCSHTLLCVTVPLQYFWVTLWVFLIMKALKEEAGCLHKLLSYLWSSYMGFT